MIQDKQWCHTLCHMLTNNVPIGWGIFSVLTPVNVNSPICPGGGGVYVWLVINAALISVFPSLFFVVVATPFLCPLHFFFSLIILWSGRGQGTVVAVLLLYSSCILVAFNASVLSCSRPRLIVRSRFPYRSRLPFYSIPELSVRYYSRSRRWTKKKSEVYSVFLSIPLHSQN